MFKRIGTDWAREAQRLASDGGVSAYFGRSVSISGDYTVVGAFGDDDNDFDAGSAYVYSGRPDAPFITIVSDTLDYGKVDKKIPFNLNLKVLNKGKITLIVSDINSSSQAFGVTYTSFSLEADSSWILVVTFTPNAIGLLNDTLLVFSNDPFNPTVTVSLKADVQAMVALNTNLTSEQSGDITFNYVIQTIDSDMITLVPEYSIDSGENWSTAKITGNITGLIPSFYSGSFVWHSWDDLPGLDLTTVRFRTLPVTAKSETGFMIETPDVNIDSNELQTIVFISTPSDEQTGDINLSFVPVDAESDILTYIEEYSEDSGLNWLPATLPGAAQIGAATAYSQPSMQLLPFIRNAKTVDEKSQTSKVNHSSRVSNSERKIPMQKQYLAAMKSKLSAVNEQRQIQANAISADTAYVVWSSGTDLFNKDITTVRFRITPVDNDTGVTLATGDFWVDNLTGPLILNNSPVERGLWSEPLLVYVDRKLDVASLDGKIMVNSKKIGNMTGTSSFDDVEMLLKFKTKSGFAGLDTIEVFLSANILDSLGNGLDGDADGDPEGSPDDDFTWTFVTPLVADYDFSNTIDFEDLAVFASAWNANPQELSKEIGPATGTVPNLTPQPDGKLDFEDLVVFLQMGTWSSQNSLSKLTKSANVSKIAVLNDYIKIEDPTYVSNGVTKLKIKPTQEIDLEVMSLELVYDQEEFESVKITKSPMLEADG